MNSPLSMRDDLPNLTEPSLLLGFSGWMDGGEVSTGTISHLVKTLKAEKIGEIAPQDFYIYNFPSPVETAARFRPKISIEDGVVASIREPASQFYADPENNLVLFAAREPNMHWEAYTKCLFEMVETLDVRNIYFAGSIASTVPHTRAPRFAGYVSEQRLLPLLEEFDIRPASYSGPGSFMTYLSTQARERSIPMLNIVSEIPAYAEGKNMRCIFSAIQKLSQILDLELNTGGLEAESIKFTERLDKIVSERPDLTDLIRRIERKFDSEHAEPENDDLRDWFQRQEIEFD
jgi:predicted ATP-grasp superfamily ATP-dependent carboligase